MKKELIKALTNIEDWEFDMLEYHIHTARMVRNIMSKNAIDEKTMAEVLHVQPKRMKEVINGSYPFDLILLSRLGSYTQKLAANATKLKVEAEIIGFAEYKDQYPMYVERINNLLSILENQNNPQ